MRCLFNSSKRDICLWERVRNLTSRKTDDMTRPSRPETCFEYPPRLPLFPETTPGGYWIYRRRGYCSRCNCSRRTGVARLEMCCSKYLGPRGTTTRNVSERRRFRQVWYTAGMHQQGCTVFGKRLRRGFLCQDTDSCCDRKNGGQCVSSARLDSLVQSFAVVLFPRP